MTDQVLLAKRPLRLVPRRTGKVLGDRSPDLFGGFIYGLAVECPLDSSSKLVLSVLLPNWDEALKLCFEGIESLRMIDLNLAGGFSIREFIVSTHGEDHTAHFSSDVDGLSMEFKFRDATFSLFELEPSLTRHYVGWDD